MLLPQGGRQRTRRGQCLYNALHFMLERGPIAAGICTAISCAILDGFCKLPGPLRAEIRRHALQRVCRHAHTFLIPIRQSLLDFAGKRGRISEQQIRKLGDQLHIALGVFLQ